MMLPSHCRIWNVRSRMVMLETIRMFTNFEDKGKAEENIYFLKEQREKLRLLRKKMLEVEGTLDASIKNLEKAVQIAKTIKKDQTKKE
ncbi:PREDICTED: uncharacterized protein LOC108966317 [Bactrocera latifrons]|uniref:uncharacterized protein LOC108966317 n=1 Tax=Bactrocera latifrons TaxID=174628 RepID=UPI0008DC737F|nr:PREDICTED: uncharacterized protein LOC108966317 [Bactrocera latifrons]